MHLIKNLFIKRIFFSTILLFTTSFIFGQWNGDTVNGGKLMQKSCSTINKTSQFYNNRGGVIYITSNIHYNNSNNTSIRNINATLIDSLGNLPWGNSDTGKAIIKGRGRNFPTHCLPDENGGAYILYRYSPRYDTSCLYLQHIDINGNSLWGEYGKLIDKIIGSFGNTRLCKLSNNEIAVAYTKEMSANYLYYGRIYIQKIASNGDLLWQNGGIPITTNASSQGGFTQVQTRDGGLLITFTDTRNALPRDSVNTPPKLDFYCQKLDSNGVLKFGPDGKAITNPSFNQFKKINLLPEEDGDKTYSVSDKHGGMYFLMINYLNTSPFSLDSIQLYVQHIDSTGQASWPNFGKRLLEGVKTEIFENAKIVEDINNGVAVFYGSYTVTNQGNLIAKLALQKITINGTYLLDSAGKFICEYKNNNQGFDVTKDSSYNYYISYTTANKYIYALKVDQLGNLPWGPLGKPINKKTNTDNAIIDFGENNKLILWLEDVTKNLLASKIDLSGNIETTRRTIISNNNGNWNNPLTWLGGIVPTSSDNVIIRSVVTVTVNTSCYNVRVEPPNGHVIVNPGVNLTITR